LTEDESESTEQFEVPESMIVYYLGLLRRGPMWTAEETPEVERLQAAHLANIRSMHEVGKLMIAGPLLDNGDLRGVYIFRVGSLGEAQALAESDPAVQAGRLIFELHPWMIPMGILPE
jgi:uncharacterized protein